MRAVLVGCAVLVGKAPVCYAVLLTALPVLRPEGSCCGAERARWVQVGIRLLILCGLGERAGLASVRAC